MGMRIKMRTIRRNVIAFGECQVANLPATYALLPDVSIYGSEIVYSNFHFNWKS